jgi:Flp pilus assembly protein protease CpaA
VAFLSARFLQGRIEANTWSTRAALLAIAIVVLAATSAAGSVNKGKSLEAMLNLLAILGLFLATTLYVRGAGDVRLLVAAQVFLAVPVALFGILLNIRPNNVPAGSA